MQTNHLDFAVHLAQKAGVIMKADFHLGMKREWKSNQTPLTVSDKKINQLVVDATEKYYPSYAVIAEEGSSIKDSKYAWVCDPIDGTIPFVHGYPTSVFAIALTKNGESILGVIYDPFMDRLVTAQKGKGTYLNNKPIHVSSTKNLKGTTIDVAGWFNKKLAMNSLSELLMSKGCMTITLRAISYTGILVAAGELAAVIYSITEPWDGAAVKIIVEEAGGKVSDLFGKDQRYDRKLTGCIASNGVLHNTLVDIINPVVKKTEYFRTK